MQSVFIHVTHKCNLSCKYCYYDAGEAFNAELTLDELKKIFKQISIIGAQRVVLTGGEPLLRSDFFNIAKAFREVNLNKQVTFSLATNGTLINKESALAIANLFDEVKISLDGPKEVNDSLRGVGTFDNAIRAINYLRRANARIIVSITACSKNIGYISDFMTSLYKDYGLTDMKINPMKPVGRAKKNDNLSYSFEDLQNALEKFKEHNFPNRLKEEQKDCTLSVIGNCSIGNYINISSDGSVFPCHTLSTPNFCLGNIKVNDLATILESPILKGLMKLDFRKNYKKTEVISQLASQFCCLGEIYNKNPKGFNDLLDSL